MNENLRAVAGSCPECGEVLIVQGECADCGWVEPDAKKPAFLIRNDVPLPHPRRKWQEVYETLDQLELGDSFIVPLEHWGISASGAIKRACAIARTASDRWSAKRGWTSAYQRKFVARRVDGGVGFWRVDP